MMTLNNAHALCLKYEGKSAIFINVPVNGAK